MFKNLNDAWVTCAREMWPADREPISPEALLKLKELFMLGAYTMAMLERANAKMLDDPEEAYARVRELFDEAREGIHDEGEPGV